MRISRACDCRTKRAVEAIEVADHHHHQVVEVVGEAAGELAMASIFWIGAAAPRCPCAG